MRSRRGFLRQTSQLAAGVAVELATGSSISHALGEQLPAALADGHTYYIDPAGNNGNSGLSPSQAWQDFVPVQRRSFGHGDTILLRRGGIWHQELVLRGAGSPGHFLVLSAYGKGKRPKIQRNGWPEERCVRLENSSYLQVSSLEVCDAGAGIVLFYDHSYGNRSVHLHDIVAHDCRAVPSPTAHGTRPPAPKDRVTWPYGIGVTGVEDTPHNQTRVLSDFRITDTEVYNTGSGIALDWGNHSCVDGTFTMSDKFGDVTMDRLHLHDNTVEGHSFGSLFLTSVTDCTISNSLIERGARYAPAGTAAVQVMYSKRVNLRNVTIRDTPFNPCPDNTGLDFECNNESPLVEGCTFIGNAGAAIELLATPGNANPYTRNLLIRDCTFEGNNWVRKQGHDPGQVSAQINVPNWDRNNRPTGTIENNRFRNAPGTVFFGGDGNPTGLTVRGNINLGTSAPEPVVLRAWNFDVAADCGAWCSHTNDIGSLQARQGALQGTVTGVDPFFFSPPDLNLPIGVDSFVRFVLRNDTPGVYGQVYFITTDDSTWNEEKHAEFWLYRSDAGFQTYDVDMSGSKPWKGTLRQLRLDPEQGYAAGTFAVQSIHLMQRRGPPS